MLQKVILSPNVCSYKMVRLNNKLLPYLWTILEVWPELEYLLEEKMTYCDNRLLSLKYLRYVVRTLSHDILLNIVFTDAYFSGKRIFLKTVKSRDKASWHHSFTFSKDKRQQWQMERQKQRMEYINMTSRHPTVTLGDKGTLGYW